MFLLRKIGIITSLVIMVQFAVGQGNDVIIAYGKFKIEWGNTDDAKILLYEDGELSEEFSPPRNGKFEFNLILNHTYMFHFKKPGYVTKKVEFNTKVPESVTSHPDFIPFPDFDFHVTLFKTYPDVDTVFFVNPVGKIMYDEKINDFDYDKDYTMDMSKRMEEIEDDIRKKHDEFEKKEREKPKKEEEIIQPEPEIVEEDLAQADEDPAEKLAPPKTAQNKVPQQPENSGEKIVQPQKTVKLENTAQVTDPEKKPKTIEAPKNSASLNRSKTTPVQTIVTDIDYAQKKRDNNLPKTKNIKKEELSGRTITRITVKQGDFSTVYIKVEHSWGGRFFFIQDENDQLRNISETFFNLKTNLK